VPARQLRAFSGEDFFIAVASRYNPGRRRFGVRMRGGAINWRQHEYFVDRQIDLRESIGFESSSF
jgi:hypothetical protein